MLYRTYLGIRKFLRLWVGGILFVMSIDQSDPVELPVGARKHEWEKNGPNCCWKMYKTPGHIWSIYVIKLRLKKENVSFNSIRFDSMKNHLPDACVYKVLSLLRCTVLYTKMQTSLNFMGGCEQWIRIKDNHTYTCEAALLQAYIKWRRRGR